MAVGHVINLTWQGICATLNLITKTFNMRIWIIILFLGLGITASAQQVIHEGKVHDIKGKSIFHNGVDVTSSLEPAEREGIFKKFKNQQKDDKNAEKARKKREKSVKKNEKAQKQAEKSLKQKQKAQDNFNKATKKLNQNQDKYNKLKEKGKLSPNDEAKWMKKLESYKMDVNKATKKLQAS